MKKIALAFFSSMLLGVTTIPVIANEEVPELEDGSKACIYIVETPGRYGVYCAGSGSFCSNLAECAIIFNP